jgi:hypothetical protein
VSCTTVTFINPAAFSTVQSSLQGTTMPWASRSKEHLPEDFPRDSTALRQIITQRNLDE